MAIENGKMVSLEYTLTVDGKVVDTSKGGQPFAYKHGEGRIIPGLSKALEGMKEGEEKNVTIPPEEAYGEISKEAFKEVPRSIIDSKEEPRVGMQLQGSGKDGNKFVVTVVEVKDDSLIVDFNHPLAGKTLVFDVKVLGVE